MKNLKILRNILHHTKADKVLVSFILFIFLDAFLIYLFEPTFPTYGDALWYCYAVISTAGFGDYVVTAFIPKILSVALTAYSLIALAIITGVVVNFYTQVQEMRDRDTMTAFMDRLENLPELTKEELHKISEDVRHFRKTGRAKE